MNVTPWQPDKSFAPPRRALPFVLGVVILVSLSGCKKKSDAESGDTTKAADRQSIQNIGSDTMVNLAQAWAEQYHEVAPNVSVEVSGGGSGVGVAALINGTADVANCSRSLEPDEVSKATQAAGHAPTEYLVAYDGLAVFVHKDNPLDAITIEQLGDIYREGGTLETWKDLGVAGIPGAKNNEIIRVSRQNNSGTYHYFRETVVGSKHDFKQGSLDMNGSKDVVELIAKTPGAIGYSGLGYATPAVKVLKVAETEGKPGVDPSITTVLDKTYPIARPLFMYTPGVPAPHVKEYIDWILSEPGQKIVEETGYVPLPKQK